jgi:tetratricopeptide (TPR) repeat protein
MLSALRSYFEEDYLASIEMNLKAIELFELNKNMRKAAVAVNNLASNYDRLGNLEANQKYLLKAIEINKKIGATNDLILNYNNLGSNYRKQNQLDKALESYSLAYKELQEVNNPFLLAQNLTNRANIYEKLENYLAAESLFLECEKISGANGIGYGVLLSNLNLGNLYRLKKQFSKSKSRLESALLWLRN